MIEIAVNGCTAGINLGRRGEHNARQIAFDLAVFTDYYGAGTAQLLHQRRGDDTPYIPAQVEQSGEKLLWTLDRDDTAVAGTGRAELRWYVGDTLAKSIIFATKTERSLGEPDGEPEQVKSALDLLTEQVEGMNQRVPSGGTRGQVLAKASGTDYDTEWTDPEGGSGGTSDYDDLQNRPSINGVTLTGNQTAENLGLATPDEIPTDNAQLENGAGYVTAATAPVRAVNGKTGAVVLVAADVGALPDSYRAPVESVNGGTGAVVLDAGDVGAMSESATLDDIPDGETYKRATAQQLGQIATNAAAIAGKQAIISAAGLLKGNGSGEVVEAVEGTDYATPAQVNAKYTKPLSGIPKSDLAEGVQASLEKANTALQEHQSLAAYRTAAAQDVIDGAQDTAISEKYTKPVSGIPKSDLSADVQTALGKTVTVSGTDPVIVGVDNTRYVCGTVNTISITPPVSGIIDVVFTSGTTAAVLTVPSTVTWANGFDPDALEADTTYEVNIMDGLGVAASWP